ncbi:MAG: hypothetical protein LUG56_09920 [Lachnospiraceae bacterium]|nr:hypothetical protein [Lachnospiraceae bacterium]
MSESGPAQNEQDQNAEWNGGNRPTLMDESGDDQNDHHQNPIYRKWTKCPFAVGGVIVKSFLFIPATIAGNPFLT